MRLPLRQSKSHHRLQTIPLKGHHIRSAGLADVCMVRSVLTTLLCVLTVAAFGFGQSTKRNVRPTTTKAVTKTESSTTEPTPAPTPSTKRNERPQTAEKPSTVSAQQNAARPNFIYEFSQPDFTVSHITIEHDDAGRGKISFMKRGLDGPESDPITLTSITLERIKAALAALNFLDSTENYQTVRDYSQMGNVIFTYRKDARERTVKYNWTDNKDAKALMDEYRRIANQYIWQFDISIARENQPLNAPSLMDELDSDLRRNEISDPRQMLPLLREISNDERIPLIARNHAARLVEKIDKSKN
jgi:hypothetical protein